MSRGKHKVSIYWDRGTPYRVDHYYGWESKRTLYIFYADNMPYYYRKWYGRNKDRYQKQIADIQRHGEDG